MREKKSLLKTLSAFSTNIASGWFGIAFISPTQDFTLDISRLLNLFYAALFGVAFLWIAFIMEEEIQYLP